MEEKKNNNGILIGIIIGIIIMLLLIGGVILFTTNTFSFFNNQQKKIENKAEEMIDKSEEITDKAEEIIDKVKEKTEEQTNQIEITGKYEQKSEAETPYYSSIIEVSNATDSSIDFKIEAAHGLDIDHINIGSLKGTATKSNVNNYIFEENGSKISFTFSNNILIITEVYEDNINPYGGHGVYFAGQYKKVS